MEGVTRKAPGRSKPPHPLASRALGSGSRSVRHRGSAAKPTGTLTKKIQGQPRDCVRTPPRRTPTDAPPETTKAQMPMARARAAGSVEVVMMIASAAGAEMADRKSVVEGKRVD